MGEKGPPRVPAGHIRALQFQGVAATEGICGRSEDEKVVKSQIDKMVDDFEIHHHVKSQPPKLQGVEIQQG